MTSVTVTHRFKASVERVFDAWLNPAKVVLWGVTRARIDARIGGRFVFETDYPDGQGGTATAILHGKFFEIVPNRKLVMSWGDNGPDGDNSNAPMVTALFQPEPDSGTTVTVTEENFDPAVSDADAEAAWATVFDALDDVFTNRQDQ